MSQYLSQKNGYGEMVIMCMDTYENNMLANDIYRKVEEAEQSLPIGDVTDGFKSLKKMREKYDL